MKKLLKAGFALGLTWCVLVPAFFMAIHAGNVLEQAEADNYEVSWALKTPLYLFGAVGLASDFAWNLSYGTVAYQEIPKEWTFTARNTRHLSSDGWRQEKAQEWCELLERVDPGHCNGFVP